MSVPKPPFHSAIEELLYNIYLKLSDNSTGMTTNDINTLAKLNAILSDADLMSATDVQTEVSLLKDGVPAVGNTLRKLYESSIIHKVPYNPVFTFDYDKEIDKDLTGLSPDITLSSAGAINGAGIIFKANKPTNINFIGIASEAHADSKTIDPAKLNVFVMVYHDNWNGAGAPRVIYTNALFNPL